MSTFTLLESAMLSEAAYADFSKAITSQDVQDTLIAEGFSQTQAANFVTQWRVVDHQPNTSTGLSATLFERLDAAENGTGEFTLAVRGTEPSILDPRDLIVDLFLATDRLSPQSLELNNYYGRLVGEGKLSPTQQLTVAGHSLGGFLAQIFANQHPSVTKHAYIYDAPGIGGVMAEVLEKFGLTAAQLNNALTDNLYAEPGSELTSNLGTMLGLITPLFIEQSKNALDNHDIKRLTDTLAVYTLFNQVDASVGTEDLGLILNAGSSNVSARLETAVAALGELFGKAILTGGYLQDDGSHLSGDGKYSYQLANQILTVTETATGGALTIENYRQSGDLAPILAAQGNVTYDSWGNVVTAPNHPEPGRADILYDTTSGDLLQSGSGNDVVFLGDGDDSLGTDYGVAGQVNADGGVRLDFAA